jgi:hypothetical protein
MIGQGIKKAVVEDLPTRGPSDRPDYITLCVGVRSLRHHLLNQGRGRLPALLLNVSILETAPLPA